MKSTEKVHSAQKTQANGRAASPKMEAVETTAASAQRSAATIEQIHERSPVALKVEDSGTNNAHVPGADNTCASQARVASTGQAPAARACRDVAPKVLRQQ